MSKARWAFGINFGQRGSQWFFEPYAGFTYDMQKHFMAAEMEKMARSEPMKVGAKSDIPVVTPAAVTIKKISDSEKAETYKKTVNNLDQKIKDEIIKKYQENVLKWKKNTSDFGEHIVEDMAVTDAEKQMAKDQKINKITVVSVIEKNYTSAKRKGMTGYEIVTYQTAEGEVYKIKVKGVIWGEDSIIEAGQTTNYEHPTHPGEFELKYRDHDKYSRRVESSFEGGVYVHEDYISEGCIVLGDAVSSDKILRDIYTKLKNNISVSASINVIDERIQTQINFRPLPYNLP